MVEKASAESVSNWLNIIVAPFERIWISEGGGEQISQRDAWEPYIPHALMHRHPMMHDVLSPGNACGAARSERDGESGVRSTVRLRPDPTRRQEFDNHVMFGSRHLPCVGVLPKHKPRSSKSDANAIAHITTLSSTDHSNVGDHRSVADTRHKETWKGTAGSSDVDQTLSETPRCNHADSHDHYRRFIFVL